MEWSPKILIVDDEPRNLLALQAALASVDCGVVMAQSGREALKCLLAQDFAVILLDIHMPELDGFETAALIRSRDRSRSTPIMFLTADDRTGARVAEGYRLGAVDYLYKPFNADILRSKVAFFCQQHRTAVALEHRTAELHALTTELERSRAAATLEHQALHDGLTGLPNRLLLYERLERAIRTHAGDGTQCALLMLDLDRFREVNDTLGHQVGDGLLRQLGRRIQAVVLSTDLVARLGGDEFAVLLGQTDAEHAAQVASDLLRALKAPFVLRSQSILMDASIGIAVAPQHGPNADMLMRHADVAMYQAKHLGVGVGVYSPTQDQHRPDRLALLDELRQAVERDELLLHYQPLLDLRDGTLVGVEALVRWQHPQRGFLPPGEFIPLAELSGLIHPLSMWVLEAALRQQQAWRALGLNIPVAVNLSRRMLHDQGLPETVARLLTRWDVPPSALLFEITESSLMADPQRASEMLQQLRGLGVRMSIDDFGTGYSSLAALKNLSVDELKIDQSFVQAMATDASARAIVRAIIDLADALKLRVVAEGIEERATWDLLVGLGCDVAQGYLMSPPVDAAALEAWLAQVGPSWLDIAAEPRAEDPLQKRIRARGARLTAEEEFIARNQAEKALHASEERSRLALQAARMGTWEVVHDVVTWTTQTEALHGLAPGTFEGTHTALRRTIHPEDWPAFEHEMQASIVEHRESLVTFRAVWPDGSLHWIEARGRGLYAADGNLLRINGTSADITWRKLTEAALRASEERFRKQYKGIPLPTYSWLQVGDDFVLEDYNDAAEVIVGDAIRDWLGRLASAHYAHEPGILADLQACAAEQRTIRREVRYRFADTERERDLAVTYVFVPPQTVMIHTEDVTEARQAEQQRQAMAQSEKLRALGQMATGIAHNLNQSLMLVASYSDLARHALAQNPPNLVELDDLMATTTQAALDAGETVNRLLLFTRAAPEHDWQAVDLSEVVREAAQLTAPRWRDAAQAEGRPISLHVKSDGRPTIAGSPGQIRELLTDLILNAVDALPTGGTIQLRVAAEDGQGVVEVTDSGVGMSAEVQAHVFEPFFTTKGDNGTGLGLAMVFGIVKRHAGHVEVRSGQGAGTTVRIRLPLAPPGASAELEAPPEVLRQLEPQHLLRILVVDDEPMMTRAVARMLKPSGHLVSLAASAEEALEKLSADAFDVVVSDVGMGGGMNGWELSEIVRRRWPSVRFLLATGWGAGIDPVRARSSGIEQVLAKPYRLVDLVDALAGADKAA